MNDETIPLSRPEANLRTTLDDCLTTGRTVVVGLPGRGRVALHPLVDRPAAPDTGADDDDDFTHRLIATNPAFRAVVEQSSASGRVPLDLELEPEE